MHGGLGMRARQRIVEQFNTDPETMVFISTDAGGLGLNLQAASYVINLDLPWNPRAWSSGLDGRTGWGR